MLSFTSTLILMRASFDLISLAKRKEKTLLGGNPFLFEFVFTFLSNGVVASVATSLYLFL